MNDQRIKTLSSFLEERVALCHQRQEALHSDGREDEAVFEKIRSNIYDIFRTVLSAGVKACGEDTQALGTFFHQRLLQIPQSWEASYHRAREHGDTEKMHLEQIKLDAAHQIREKFESLWGENS